jgi:dienelactone hydrolase
VLIIPDVIGIYPNSQFLADDFAANGYLTIIPDIFRGDAFNPAKEQLMEWLPRHSVDDVERVVDAAISYLRNEAGVKKIGAVGYCFGGKYVCRYLKDKRVDAGFTAHPSFVTAEELAAISGPLSIAAAGMFCLLSIDFAGHEKQD